MDNKEEKKNKKINYGLMIALVIAIVAITAGVTFAYFSAIITGNESSSTISIKGAQIELTFANGTNQISGTNIAPGWSDTKDFTVTAFNNSGKSVEYFFEMHVQVNTFQESGGYLTYSLEKITATSTTTDNGVSTKATEVAKGSITPQVAVGGTESSFTLKVDDTAATPVVYKGAFESSDSTSTHTYTLTVEYPESDSSQNANQGAKFAAYLKLDSDTQIYETTTTTTTTTAAA